MDGRALARTKRLEADDIARLRLCDKTCLVLGGLSLGVCFGVLLAGWA